MCGIVGYVGDSEAQPILAAGLKNLEYRGYDSAGVGLVGASVDVYKQEGTIDELDLPDSSPATTGIAHTRWSTHGEPTDYNAHPHTDCTGDLAVVHNGIVENYESLKTELRDRDHEFTSDTDTEVIPHLVEELYDGDDLEAAVTEAVARLEGSFAVCVVAAGREEIVAARQDSPLVVGHGTGSVQIS